MPIALTATAATATETLVTSMGTAATTIQSLIGNAVEYAIPVASTVLAITVGWRLFRNFTRG